MKILHTSDWHIGRALYGRKRNEEFSQFLNWMIATLSSEKIDVLLIAGDIFDTTTPSNWAQNLYYHFLSKVQKTCCTHVIITAGNHDSATFLEAAAGILKTMNIHIVGSINDDIDKEIVQICDPTGETRLIVCAVPYLRERDIRLASPGETIEEKSNKLVQGIKQHYDTIIKRAVNIQTKASNRPIIIALGHLFAAGGMSVTGDGVRELYVGSLAHVPASIFPEEIDYLALGHLHSSQLVGKNERRRYCGSPLPMSFGEGTKPKKVITVECDQEITEIKTIDVPCFQRLESIAGNMEVLLSTIEQLKGEDRSIWLEIKYNSKELIASLQEDLRQAVAGSKLEILRIVNSRIIDSILESETSQETLEQLSVEEVFDRCLTQNSITGQQHDELTLRFNVAVDALQQREIE
ncbi:MAG: exonuclease sbcCD subunit D [Desulfotalea sp.]|nr:MAG: exonuclease sbcCD subunit D [Desulfotalea sp.]